MKVKEYIEYLKKLDQSRGIWVVYDSYDAFNPIPDETADASRARAFSDDGMKEGDYIITAG